MEKKDLEVSQPVAWKTLSNALKQERLSHAYLFYGPKDAPKSAMALLMAQSLFCENPDENGFACQNCSTCQRIAAQESLDFFWLHPGGLVPGRSYTKKEIEAWWKQGRQALETQKQADYRVKKSSILSLQDAFVKSASEGKKQVYILEGYDTATTEASNALLKFLEEPKEDLVGILIADEVSNVLPTIVSRCQLVPFRPASKASMQESLKRLCPDEETAEMFCENGIGSEAAKKMLELENYEEIKEAARTYYEKKFTHGAIVTLQSEVFYPKSPALSKAGLELLLQWLLYLVKQDSSLPARQALSIRLILLEALDTLKIPADMALLLDQVCYKILQTAFAEETARN